MHLLMDFYKDSDSSDCDKPQTDERSREAVKDERESKNMCPSVQKWVNEGARSTVESLQPEHLTTLPWTVTRISSHKAASHTGNYSGTALNTGISVIHVKISKYSNEVYLSGVPPPCASLPSEELPKFFANELILEHSA